MSLTESYTGDVEFEIGDLVETTKVIRNDGTYPDPDIKVGDVLVEAGVRGVVINVGIYLQEHIIYAVSFQNGKTVGCLTRELTSPDIPPPTPSTPPSRTSSTVISPSHPMPSASPSHPMPDGAHHSDHA